jgi:hypothetical protein
LKLSCFFAVVSTGSPLFLPMPETWLPTTDDEDTIRGIFGEFDALPADGHSGAYSWWK